MQIPTVQKKIDATLGFPGEDRLWGKNVIWLKNALSITIRRPLRQFGSRQARRY